MHTNFIRSTHEHNSQTVTVMLIIIVCLSSYLSAYASVKTQFNALKGQIIAVLAQGIHMSTQKLILYNVTGPETSLVDQKTLHASKLFEITHKIETQHTPF